MPTPGVIEGTSRVNLSLVNLSHSLSWVEYTPSLLPLGSELRCGQHCRPLLAQPVKPESKCLAGNL